MKKKKKDGVLQVYIQLDICKVLEYDGKHKQLAPLKGGEIVLH